MKFLKTAFEHHSQISIPSLVHNLNVRHNVISQLNENCMKTQSSLKTIEIGVRGHKENKARLKSELDMRDCDVRSRVLINLIS